MKEVNLDELSEDEACELLDEMIEAKNEHEEWLDEHKGPKGDKLDDHATKRKIDSIQARFMVRNPFWATIAARLKVKVQNFDRFGNDLRPLPTFKAAVDGEVIYLFPKWFKEATTAELDVVFEHETQHVARAHHLRMGRRDPQIWNMATDHVINNSILEQGMDAMDDWLCSPDFKGMEEEKVYRLLKEECDQNGGSGQSSDPNGDQSMPQDGSATPNHPDWSKGQDQGAVIPQKSEDGSVMDSERVQQKLKELSRDIEMAKSMAPKRPGQSGDPSGSADLDHMRAKKDWSSILRKFVRDQGTPIGRSWTSLDRRSLQQGLYQPKQIKEGVDHLVIAVDVSGSIMMPELRAFMRQINRMRSQMDIRRISVVSFSHEILESEIKELKQRTPMPQKWVVGGGTAFTPVFDWTDKLPRAPEALIIFTDMGSADFPEKAPKYPVMWASSVPKNMGWGKAPWGTFIEIDLNDGKE